MTGISADKQQSTTKYHIDALQSDQIAASRSLLMATLVLGVTMTTVEHQTTLISASTTEA